MRSLLIAFISGATFAIGLAVSGMTDPAKVEAFLDLGAGWDPSLAFVMGGAIGVHALAYVAQRRLPGPIGGHGGWKLAPLHGVDGWLIGGAVLFGLGWGVSGWCPGPALVASATLDGPVLAFVGAMVVGLAIGGRLRPAYVGAPAPVVEAAAADVVVAAPADEPVVDVCG